ncbi:hypothetical protein ACF1GY_37080 [Streptomyces sp. NPDC014684]|uniref:hypothetical protein n=1 Tax=Streptomyces sp. NPDC014684 TaxID=3364880 RepID=UPI0036FD88D4
MRIAALAQPCADRAELVEEAEAELAFILDETGGLPLTRLWRGLRYAGGLVKGSPHLSGERSSASVWFSSWVSGCGFTMAAFALFMAWDGSWKYSSLGMLILEFNDGPTPGLGRLYWLAGMANEVSSLASNLSFFILGVAMTFAGRVNLQHWGTWEIMKVPTRVAEWGISLWAYSGIVGGLAGVEINMPMGGFRDAGVMVGIGMAAASIMVLIFLRISHNLIKKHLEDATVASTSG